MSPKISVPNVKLNSGFNMPLFGLGTWKSKPGEVTEAVKCAIDAGYRHIDCAHAYLNESEVGAAIKAKIDEGVVTRDELFITSKLWCTFHSTDKVVPALKTTLKNLGLDFLDLYLVHWPLGYQEGGELFPKDADDKTLYSDIDYVDTWKGMEACVNEGLAKSIGVSNFNSQQIERVLAIAKIPPAVNQIECHPYLNQKKLMEFCKAKGITITAYSPLGSPDRPWAKPDDPKLTEDPKLVELSKKYKKSTAQVVLRYQVQRGNITIPKSVNKGRIEENIDIFDFELTPEDMAYIDTFDCDGRICHMKWCSDHKYWPFGIDF